MKKLFAAIALYMCPASASADELAIEVGSGALQANFTSDRDADINVTRHQPFVRLEYGSGRWVSNYTIIATELTNITYGQRLNENYRASMDLSSATNVFVAQGLKIHILRLGNFRLHAMAQYELSLWDFQTELDSVVVSRNENEMDITEWALDHVRVSYGWQRLQFALSAEYALWKFTPFVTIGWNILDANITFSYDQEGRDMLAIFGQNVPAEDRDHFRSGSLLGTLGTEFSVWNGFSLRAEGIAVPDTAGWVYAAQGSVIFRP